MKTRLWNWRSLLWLALALAMIALDFGAAPEAGPAALAGYTPG
ncbi:MAG TPA: hypothetical protein VFV27_05210 [Nevskiaceae bacterium]|nr:hypothetical protein [Nevskiaceae bacterium]